MTECETKLKTLWVTDLRKHVGPKIFAEQLLFYVISFCR